MVRNDNERPHINGKIRYKDTSRLQKTGKSTAKMGRMSEEGPNNSEGTRKVERKCQQLGAIET